VGRVVWAVISFYRLGPILHGCRYTLIGVGGTPNIRGPGGVKIHCYCRFVSKISSLSRGVGFSFQFYLFRLLSDNSIYSIFKTQFKGSPPLPLVAMYMLLPYFSTSTHLYNGSSSLVRLAKSEAFFPTHFLQHLTSYIITANFFRL
jgi:hypothetical protein